MPMDHDAVAAIPATISAGLLRALVVGRLIYFLGADDPQELVAIDADTGATVPALALGGRLYWHDPEDATTAHDGIVCLVTHDGQRYKYDGADLRLAGVLAVQVDPAEEPAFGDAWLVAEAAIGAWTGKDDHVAIWTAAGWAFVPPAIGWWLYVEEEDGFRRYTADGAWIGGPGAWALADGTVLPSNLLGGKVAWAVENQTTNTPPSSPEDGAQYIIGPEPTGDWAGDSGKLAIAYNGAWIVIQPRDGYTAYDKAQSNLFVYRSGWQSAAGSYVSRFEHRIGDADTPVTIEHAGSTGANSGSGYTYSQTSAPTASDAARAVDTYQPVIAAKRAGARFELDWWGLARVTQVNVGSGNLANSTTDVTAIALFVDSESSPRDWHRISETVQVVNTAGPGSRAFIVAKRFVFEIDDTSAHTIRIRFFARVTRGNTIGTVEWSALEFRRRSVIIREAG